MNDIWSALAIFPLADDVGGILKRAQLADDLDFDLVTLADLPMTGVHLDTWIMLTAIAMKTNRVRIGTVVANIRFRPPAMLAKQAATLSLLTNRDVELGIGAGEGVRTSKASLSRVWQVVHGRGSRRGRPGEIRRDDGEYHRGAAIRQWDAVQPAGEAAEGGGHSPTGINAVGCGGGGGRARGAGV